MSCPTPRSAGWTGSTGGGTICCPWGVYQPKKKIEESKLPVALTRFLEDHPHVKTVYLHLDNDTAGRLAAKAIMAVMPEGYRVENKPPPRGKDVNDFLCHRLGIPIRGSHGKEPER